MKTMLMNRYFKMSQIHILLMLLLLSCSAWPQSANVSVFFEGLNNPRGLKFGPDANLYVAEGGAGGTLSSTGLCDQVVPPVGPYYGRLYIPDFEDQPGWNTTYYRGG